MLPVLRVFYTTSARRSSRAASSRMNSLGVARRHVLTTPPLHGSPSTHVTARVRRSENTSTCTAPSLSFAAASLVPADVDASVTVASNHLTVQRLSRLAPHQQAHLLQLRRMLARTTALARQEGFCRSTAAPERTASSLLSTSQVTPPPPMARRKAPHPHKTHVVCRVECDPLLRNDSIESLLAETGGTSSSSSSVEPRWFMGVNHALHSCVNHCNPCGDANALPSLERYDDARKKADTPLLKGILKGCAEQNALGALAASGLPYPCASSVYLASSSVDAPSTCRHDHEKGGGVFFPCPECWHHLTRLGELRASKGLARVQLFVWTGSAGEAVSAMSVATQRMERERGLVDVVLVTDA